MGNSYIFPQCFLPVTYLFPFPDLQSLGWHPALSCLPPPTWEKQTLASGDQLFSLEYFTPSQQLGPFAVWGLPSATVLIWVVAHLKLTRPSG